VSAGRSMLERAESGRLAARESLALLTPDVLDKSESLDPADRRLDWETGLAKEREKLRAGGVSYVGSWVRFSDELAADKDS
jgi:hypothetical protein